ncbi:uncharacterized protein BX664DRAFT_325369 [Halteromyces radiatus]|uniref:uncharacterized protein n=1 Tax=Halteromyces radiatus TaxID=101107 RepID=UPI00221FA90F|nr:uncharacterized protein BX664DRAFT_325369 [Halteromyces radiatus]KAI8096998.1 hypothetical protein BX664DRAFT_325369 [Halteromyces radiatus]
MGAQQSKPKRRQKYIKSTQPTIKNISPISKSSSSQQSLTSSTFQQQTNGMMTEQQLITRTPNTNENNDKHNNAIDENQQTNTWINRFVEPDSLTLQLYLDQRTMADLFVDGDFDDMPDFYDVESTISSQHSNLFSTLSSITPSSISSISSVQIDNHKSSSSYLLRQSSSTQSTFIAALDDDFITTNDNRLETFDDLLALAEQNNRVELAYCVAVCYYRGWYNVQVDYEKAFHWFEQAAILGNYQYQQKSGFTAEKDDKMDILPLVALAQYRTGKMLLQQDDNNRAWYYLNLAAKNGNSRAEYLVGWQAEKRENDIQKAFYWYLSSWRHGLVEAQAALGCLLINHATTSLTMDLGGLSISGLSSVMSRDQQALYLLEDAAKKDNLTALLQLGSLYTEGKHVERNTSLAIVYYKKASTLVDLDNANYQVIHYMLGREYRYLDGNRTFDSSLVSYQDGTTHYHQQAIKHFELACTPLKDGGNGYALAQRSLGHMYYIDTNKNDSVRLLHKQKAHDLFEKAAAQGDVTAMGFLGEQYERGIGCKQDMEKALFYYRQAMETGSSVGELALALLLHRMERYQEAYQHFTQIANQPSMATKLIKETKISEQTTADRSSYQILLEQDISKTKCRAQYMVARYLHNGWGGCIKDPIKAFFDLVHLADVDEFAPAYYWVAIGYKDGVTAESKADDHHHMEVQPDLMRALGYFEKAALLNNDQDAQMQLATMCSNGFNYSTTPTGTIKHYKDRAAALKWYMMAADQHKNAAAQYCTGIYYAKGLAPLDGKDVVKAEAYYEASAKQGYTLAMVQLAQLIIQETASINGDDDWLDDTFTRQRYNKAFDWLMVATKKQEPGAYRELAHMYEKGYHPGLIDDTRYQKGFTLLEHPLLTNDAQAWCAKSRYYEHGWFVDQDLEQSVACLEQAVKLNYLKADLYIAELYERNGKNDHALSKYHDIIKKHPLRSQVGWFSRLNLCRMLVHSNSSTSLSEQHLILGWLHEMTDQNAGEASIEPLLLLATCYEVGFGTSQNLTEAKLFYEKATKIKHSSINNQVHWPQQNAYFYLAKLCVEQHLYDEAFSYFKQLELNLNRMNRHSPETRRHARQVRYYLGYLLLNGYGTSKDEEKGIHWLTQAADEGEGDACYTLGKLYLEKKQHDDDNYVQEASKRFDQGVSSGHPGCMRELALIIQQEHQADKDWDGMETYDLLEQAQRLGDVEALVRMAVAVQYGLGTVIKKGNTTMALGWYRAAAQQGHPKAAVYAAVAFHELQQHDLAVEWFQMQPESLVSKVWLAFYRLKGVGGLVADPVQAFSQLVQIVNDFKFDQQNDIGDRNALGLAYYLVGRCYEEGEGTEIDGSKAMIYYELAKQRTQDVEATYRLGALLFQQYPDDDDESSIVEQQQRAFECFDTAASKGNLEAKYMVGVYHARGLGGMAPDNAAAQIHLQRAIRDGHTRAILELGHVLWSTKNFNKAITQFKKAAELKIPEASYHLGRLYHEGVRDRSSSGHGTSSKGATQMMIIPQDYHQAFFYFMKAVEQEHAMATMMIGIYYQEGHDAAFHPVDLMKALHYYKLAYERLDGGSDRHMVELAIAKLLHTMAEQDDDESDKYHQMAFDWFLQASPIGQDRQDNDRSMEQIIGTYDERTDKQQPLYEAQMMVAFYYLNGWGSIEKDQPRGFELLLDAANHGASIAFIDVAKCYENGIGVEEDKSQAYHYWSFAADMNLVEAMDRVSLYHREGWGGLTPDDDTADIWEAKANLLRQHGDSDRDSSIYTTSSSNTSTY